MNNTLPCAVVRDLLPSYAEQLTEAETSAAVAEHLKICPDCRQRFEAMTASLNEEQTGDDRQVDYLKGVRRHGRVRMALTALAVVLVFAVCGLLSLFVIGGKVDPGSVAIRAALTEDNMLELEVLSTGSADAFARWHTEVQDGVMTVTARRVLVSPLYASGGRREMIGLEGLRQIDLFGQTVWKDGLLLQEDTQQMLSHRVQYVGNNSAIGALSGVLPLPKVLFTQQLQTGAEPYGWTVCFSQPLTLTQQLQVRAAAPLALALVDNLGVFSWEWPDETGVLRTESVTLEEANALLAEKAAADQEYTGRNDPIFSSVKDYADDVFSLQLLRNYFGV